MNIQNNPFFKSDKIIKPYQCSIIAQDGPNIVDRVDLSSLAMTFQDVNATTMTLPATTYNIPVMMQENTSYLLILVDYYEGIYNPQCKIEEQNFIEYYFQGQSNVVRYIGQIMILTGNVDNVLPKVYLNNPQDRDLTIKVMSSNLESSTGQTSSNIFNNLYYNSIISDNINSGSSYLSILDATNTSVLTIPYTTIVDYSKSGNTINLTATDKDVTLIFLSEFNAFQALSRISWVLTGTSIRNLTINSPSVDITSPVITWANTGTTFQATGLTLDYIRTYYLSSVTDNRDGNINISNVNEIVFELNQNVILTGITHEGLYTVVFEVSDLADNKTTSSYDIIVDNTPPVIDYQTIASGTGFTMDISGDTATPGTINDSDISVFSIDSVTDNIDGVIPNGSVVISPSSITSTGTYTVTYTVEDTCLNQRVDSKTLIVI